MQSVLLLNDPMATSKEIRTENLRALVKEFKTADAVAQRASTAPMYLSQILNSAKSSTGTARGVGDKLARKLEAGCGKPEGWMDADHGLAAETDSPEDQGDPVGGPVALPFMAGVSRVRVGEPTADMTPIKLVTMHLQAGIMGFEVQQDFDDGGTLDVPTRWINEGDYVPHCLMAIKVRGDSMQPLLYQGDIAVVNIADTKKVSGGVYAINFNGEPVVKRLRYEGRDWYLTSENSSHPRRLCKGGACIIVGRIVRFEARNFKDRL